MRNSHELEKGIICEHCGDHVFKGNYIRIVYEKPITNDSTGKSRRIGRANLCNSCYTIYDKFMKEFSVFRKR